MTYLGNSLHTSSLYHMSTPSTKESIEAKTINSSSNLKFTNSP